MTTFRFILRIERYICRVAATRRSQLFQHVKICPEMLNLSTKLGQIGPKLDKSGTFLRSVSVHFVPIWTTLDPTQTLQPWPWATLLLFTIHGFVSDSCKAHWWWPLYSRSSLEGPVSSAFSCVSSDHSPSHPPSVSSGSLYLKLRLTKPSLSGTFVLCEY